MYDELDVPERTAGTWLLDVTRLFHVTVRPVCKLWQQNETNIKEAGAKADMMIGCGIGSKSRLENVGRNFLVVRSVPVPVTTVVRAVVIQCTLPWLIISRDQSVTK